MTCGKSLYDEACHGWDGVEPVVFDREPRMVLALLLTPVLGGITHLVAMVIGLGGVQ